VKGDVTAVLIFISFMARGAEHFFICWLNICISSSENSVINLFPYFLIKLLLFWCLVFWTLCMFSILIF
jgi:hypothetical protein